MQLGVSSEITGMFRQSCDHETLSLRRNHEVVATTGRYASLASENKAMAEGEGFEPPLRFPVKRFSRPSVSTAHTTLRGC
jgi:hypothetical protein